MWGGEQPVPLTGKAKNLSHLPCFPCRPEGDEAAGVVSSHLDCSLFQKIEGSDVTLSYPLLCVVL